MERKEAEQKLVKACLSGNSQSQCELYNSYARAMYNVCHRMMSNSAEAEDMLQEAFITVFQKLDSYRFDASLGSWIKRIVVNKCINTIRANKKTIIESLENSVVSLEEETTVEPHYDIANIKNAIRQLSPGYKVITNLYLFEGYDHGEIAQILEISESTSKSQYHRAKKKIIELINNN